MNVKTKRWLVVYGIVAHALVALLYWQNAMLRSDSGGAIRVAVQPTDVVCAAGCRYQALMVEHLAAAVQNRSTSLHLLGDSIVALWPAGSFPEPVSNLGIGGDLSSGLAHRVSRYPFVQKDHRAVVHIGINDVLRGEEAHTVETVEGIIDVLSTRGVQVVLSAMLPVDEQVVGRAINARVHDLNAQLAKTCADNIRCEFADAGGAMRDSNGQLNTALHTGDGIHLNADGYEILTRTLRNALPAQ